MTQPSPAMTRRPNFLVIGAMKCGTSTVCRFLELHPQVFMVPNADPDFFSNDRVWAQGWPWYESLFAAAADQPMRGEGSNSYTQHARFPHACERIAEHLPEAKLIYIVRDPIARIRSAWGQIRADQGDNVHHDINEAVRLRPELFADTSCYWRQLSLYRRHYPDDRIWVGFMEDLKTQPLTFFTDLCRFLGIDTAPADEHHNLHQNPSSAKAVPTALYSRLRANPLVRGLTRCVLPTWRYGLRDRLLTKPIRDMPALTDDTLAWLSDQIADDAKQLLAYCGKPTDFWTLR